MKTFAPLGPTYRWVLKQEGRLWQKWREYKTRRIIDSLPDHILQDIGWPLVEHDRKPDGSETPLSKDGPSQGKGSSSNH